MNELEGLYQQIILDAARERYGEGDVDSDVSLSSGHGCSHQVNPSCGDEVTMHVQLSEDGNRLEDITWQGQGCSISQASISIMTEMLEGASVEDSVKLYDVFKEMLEARGADIPEEHLDLLEDAAAFQGVSQFPMRIKCALLGWIALRDATNLASVAKENDKETVDE